MKGEKNKEETLNGRENKLKHLGIYIKDRKEKYVNTKIFSESVCH